VRGTGAWVGDHDARERARRELERLPPAVRAIERAQPGYPVDLSPALRAFRQETIAAVSV
jgi:hypothetical protein